jgi:hypothetical protein
MMNSDRKHYIPEDEEETACAIDEETAENLFTEFSDPELGIDFREAAEFVHERALLLNAVLKEILKDENGEERSKCGVWG